MQTTPTCPSCGRPLGPNAPQGLCQKCLLEAGFPTGTDTGGGSRFVPPKVEELAPKFPQLDILEFVGQGGMGAVYKARQKQLDRIVALKILPPRKDAGPGFAERFAREARALAQLNHPHIVTLYEFGEREGLFYFLMEFVDGLNLRQVLKAGRLAPKEALAIVPQICDALEYAHARGIVHRDIKPENILLSREGRVKIADFGVAKIVGQEQDGGAGTGEVPVPTADLTRAGSTVGTPQYMAPEQLRNSAEVDHRADIYSLGVVFYQMLTGELPSGRLESPSRKVAIDVRLDEVVLRAMEREPARRYQHVSEVKELVETISQIAATAGRQESRALLDGRLRVAVLASAALLVVAVAAAFFLHAYRSRNSAPLVAPAVAVAVTNPSPPLIEYAQPKPAPKADNVSASAITASFDLSSLIQGGEYEKALQLCLDTYNAGKTNNSWNMIIYNWGQLGRKYPKAQEALLAVRASLLRDLSEGRDESQAFSDVSMINTALDQQDDTYQLYDSFRKHNPPLADKCYGTVQSLLVARGEYQWCYQHLGGAQLKFESLRNFFQMNQENFRHNRAMHELMKAKMPPPPLRVTPVHGSNVVPPPFSLTSSDDMMLKQNEDRFTAGVRELIEILVGSGHKVEAEKIRIRALEILDNEPLRSAISDAEAKIKTPQTGAKTQ